MLGENCRIVMLKLAELTDLDNAGAADLERYENEIRAILPMVPEEVMMMHRGMGNSELHFAGFEEKVDGLQLICEDWGYRLRVKENKEYLRAIRALKPAVRHIDKWMAEHDIYVNIFKSNRMYHAYAARDENSTLFMFFVPDDAKDDFSEKPSGKTAGIVQRLVDMGGTEITLGKYIDDFSKTVCYQCR